MPRLLDPTKRKLTDAHCKNAQPKPTENGELRTIKLSDGYGLNLEVRRDGKFWFYAYRLYGKQLKLSLGSYPNVKLSDAREMHEKAWSADAVIELGKWLAPSLQHRIEVIMTWV